MVDGINPTGGKIAVTAARIGTLRGDPRQMLKLGNPLLSRMQKEFGMENEDLKVLQKMQEDYGKSPNKPGHVADTLSGGMSYLRGREQSGVDVSAARIAFLANGFALTSDLKLRTAIFSDLSRNHQIK